MGEAPFFEARQQEKSDGKLVRPNTVSLQCGARQKKSDGRKGGQLFRSPKLIGVSPGDDIDIFGYPYAWRTF